MNALEENPTKPPSHLYQQLLDQEITMMPEVAVRALQLANSPECDVEQFASLVERDVKLAADLLMLANSVAFGGGTRIGSIYQAVVRIGLRDCRHMIVASSYKSLMSKCSLSAKWIRSALWRHSVFTGMVCRHIDRRFKMKFEGDAFTAALMHDIGRLLLSGLISDKYLDVDPLDFDEVATDPVSVETAAWGMDHSQFGGWFLEHNDLPESLVQAARLHHTPPRVGEAFPRLVALVRLGDHAGNYFQSKDSVEGYDPESVPDLDWWEASLGSEFRAEYINEIGGIMEQSLSDMVEMVRGDS